MNNFKVILKPNEEILKNLFAVEGFLLYLAYWHYSGTFVFFIQIFFFGTWKSNARVQKSGLYHIEYFITFTVTLDQKVFNPLFNGRWCTWLMVRFNLFRG